MSIQELFSLDFSSSERSRGEDLFARNAVLISSASDTFVRALIRGSIAARVSLSCTEVGANSISIACSCPVGRKDRLCRHAWAVLLKLEDGGYDFLEGKSRLDMASDKMPEAETEAVAGYTEQQKLRAKEYRRQNSEKLKARQKEFKEKLKSSAEARSGKKIRPPVYSYPEPVEEARRYFQANGFDMNQPMELDELLNAKKQLSRVFHPDKGGTHDEILALNENFRIIHDYLKS